MKSIQGSRLSPFQTKFIHRMSALCTIKHLCQATRSENKYTKRFFGILLTQTAQKWLFSPFWIVVPNPRKSAVFGLTQPFCTDEKSHTQPKRKAAFGSVGRRIPYRILHLINQDGESLGNMHRAEALKLMDQHSLKLVLLRENVEPPVYKLMTGQQIHEEQLKRAEKKKSSPKPGVVQKELSFSSAIAKNDLETKTKQIAQWIEKKHHVKVTIRQAKGSSTDMFTVFDHILETVSEKATYLSKPKVAREGVSTCVLRHMSDKELKEHQKMDIKKNNTVKEDENKDLKSKELHQ
ncbi:PREDICTED: translation initiation factor IF-3, mitochondrial isoform X1 [Pseudopodoces humilis]|uniref:translation initiation factor IF-3, mitochondrial isoform X1 n=2 Tax=Pseudopodoces humilis TaxID=181119 RepID=UPI0006B6D5DC|nr:PREDICTED: translation initiation factor IF-3, mitochondrial isoform X1 [Pseudopodoces humilis]